MTLFARVLVILSICLAIPLCSRADVIYSFNFTIPPGGTLSGSNIQWSFQNPTIFTSTGGTLLQPLSVSGPLAARNCGPVALASIVNPSTAAEVDTEFFGCGPATILIPVLFQPGTTFTSLGTYNFTAGGVTFGSLSITSAPEPSSFMLLAIGLMGAIKKALSHRAV
jgi:hypothetical protein